MSAILKKSMALAIGILLSVLILLAAGCKKGGDSSASSGAGSAGGSTQTAAAGLFQSNGCSRCHALNGGGGGRAPDLTHAGAEHDAEWIAAHIKNPRTHNPGSRMPAFEGKMSDSDIQSLAGYLASLK